jgi:hypothetical protein
LIMTAVMFFGVKKGKKGDICPVWSATKNGVDPSVFAPRFFMPSVETMCQKLYPGVFCADFDIGEMFLNFRLHPAERRFHGVNLPKEL